MAKLKKVLFGAALLLLVSSRKKEDPLVITDLYINLSRSTIESYPVRQLSNIEQIVVHHAAVQGQTAVDYARYHVETKGWAGIGYHFVIERDGTVIQGNPLENISNHVTGQNTKSIGICLSGNFEIENPTEIQEKRLGQLISKLRADLPQRLQVYGHRDFKATSCPGSSLYSIIQKYQLA
jgi:N-acetyl-anhydromuramyl-L-alanine amidase AmpD